MTDTFDVSTDEFHCLDLADTMFYIDLGTRRQVEAFLVNAKAPWEAMTIDDLAGAEVLVIAGRVNAIWSTTPEIRAFYVRAKQTLNNEDL